jgi:hypothetical protein
MRAWIVCLQSIVAATLAALVFVSCAADPADVHKTLVALGFPRLEVVSSSGIDESTSDSEVVLRDADDPDTVFAMRWPMGGASRGEIAAAFATGRANARATEDLLAKLHAAGVEHVRADTVRDDASEGMPLVELRVIDALTSGDRETLIAQIGTALGEWARARRMAKLRVNVRFFAADPSPGERDVLPNPGSTASDDDSSRSPYVISTVWRPADGHAALDDALDWMPVTAAQDCSRSGCVADDPATRPSVIAAAKRFAARVPPIERGGRRMRASIEDTASILEQRLSPRDLERVREYGGFCYRPPSAPCRNGLDGAVAITLQPDSHRTSEARLIDARAAADGFLPPHMEPDWR